MNELVLFVKERVDLDVDSLMLDREHLVENECLAQPWEPRHDVRDFESLRLSRAGLLCGREPDTSLRLRFHGHGSRLPSTCAGPHGRVIPPPGRRVLGIDPAHATL